MKKHFLTILLVAASGLASHATILTVDNRPGAVAGFSSLQAAHDTAASGDTIIVSGSPVSYGDIALSKPLHIRGAGMAFVSGTSASNALTTDATLTFEAGSSGSVISGFVATCVFGVENVSITDSVVLNGNTQFNSETPGGHIFQRCYFSISSTSPSHCEYTNCIWSSDVISEVASRALSGVGIVFDRCTVGLSDAVGSRPTWTVRNSVFVHTVGLFPRDAIVENSVSISTAKESSFLLDGDGPSGFMLNHTASDNPAVGATPELDLGAFGGPQPFSLNLNSHLPRIKTLSVSPAVSETSGLRIQLEAVAGGE